MRYQEIRTDFDFIARFVERNLSLSSMIHLLKEPRLVAARMQAAVYDLNIEHNQNMDYGRVTISMGISLLYSV